MKTYRYNIGGYSGDQLDPIVAALVTDADGWPGGRAALWEVVMALAVALSSPAPPSSPTGWQPIETARKDGETVIVYDPNYSQSVVAASWDNEVAEEGGQTWRAVDAWNDRLNPTMWTSFPAPPPARSGGADGRTT